VAVVELRVGEGPAHSYERDRIGCGLGVVPDTCHQAD
jgi:hypothetical protein